MILGLLALYFFGDLNYCLDEHRFSSQGNADGGTRAGLAWHPRFSHCNTLQRTATHCNTLQHTAAHCTSLQHTATHCRTLQQTGTPCNSLQHTATHCNTLQHTATHCDTLRHTATHCDTLQHRVSSEGCTDGGNRAGLAWDSWFSLWCCCGSRCVAVCYSLLQCVLVLQCVAVCCSRFY